MRNVCFSRSIVLYIKLKDKFYTNVISFDSMNESRACIYFRSMLHSIIMIVCMFRCVETRVRQFLLHNRL